MVGREPYPESDDLQQATLPDAYSGKLYQAVKGPFAGLCMDVWELSDLCAVQVTSNGEAHRTKIEWNLRLHGGF